MTSLPHETPKEPQGMVMESPQVMLQQVGSVVLMLFAARSVLKSMSNA